MSKLTFAQKMAKAIEEISATGNPKLLEETIKVLEKARRLADEYDPNDPDPDNFDINEEYGAGQAAREFDPDEEESAGDDWLKENDPSYKKEDYEEYDENDDEEAHRSMAESKELDDVDAEEVAATPTRTPGAPAAAAAPAQTSQTQIESEDSPEEVKGKRSRFRQPSKEEIISMRSHTRPWEQRARDMTRLQADPSKNPVLHHYGNIIEARNTAHADRKSAYEALTSSPEYKDADPIAQMELDDKFEQNWKSKNPEHLSGALKSHGEAHTKGKAAHGIHAATKDEQIRHILTGGAQPEESMSLEEALQHAGGAKGEEGTTGSVTQDKATSFAHGNKEFIDQYAKAYANKAHKVKSPEEMMDYNDNSRKDISRVLGPAATKDPKVEAFFAHYYPLIGMSAHKVVNKLGLDRNSPDVDMSMLHEAGMHGLMQAINDYDHDHQSGASFSTHAGNKMKGLMQTAFRNQDQIPHEVRQAQKKFASQKMAPPSTPSAPPVQAPAAPAPKIDMHQAVAESKHPAKIDIHDRHKRISAQQSIQGIKKPGGSDA